MFQGINPKLMKQAMKKMGVKQEKINASEVIIKTPEKDIIIKNPEVSKVHMMGQETFQVIGDVSEEIVKQEDIETVMQQTNCNEEQAKKALEENNNDLAKAILSLKQ